MECPHCGKMIHSKLQKRIELPYGENVNLDNNIEEPIEGCKDDILSIYICPSCKERIIERKSGIYYIDSSSGEGYWDYDDNYNDIIYPLFAELSVNKYVPTLYANEIKRANAIINISSDASAVLSRRILQLIINREFQIKQGNLKKDISKFLERKDLPDYLIQALNHVREYGNTAAHGKSVFIDNVYSVTNKQAKYLIDTLIALFDYAFIQPKRTQEFEERLHGEDNKDDIPF